jgi:hypothetical protein
MEKRSFPDFPILFETIGQFLRKAEVPPRQKEMLDGAIEAYYIIVSTVYSQFAKRGDCASVSRIPTVLPRVDAAK